MWCCSAGIPMCLYACLKSADAAKRAHSGTVDLAYVARGMETSWHSGIEVSGASSIRFIPEALKSPKRRILGWPSPWLS